MNTAKRLFSVANTPELSRLCRYLSEGSPQPMVAVEGLTHIIRYVNPAFCRLAGKSREELIGHLFAKAVPEGDQNNCMEVLDRVFCTGQAELLAEQKHGQTPDCYWSYSVWAILDDDEQPAGVMVQVTDSSKTATISRRVVDVNAALVVSAIRQQELTDTAENLNKDLRAATRAKNQFLAAMSHEIRTPLTAIMGFSELVIMSDLTEDDRYDYGERIRRNALLLLRLISDILDLSKVEAGKLEIEKIEVNLPEVLSDVDMMMRYLAREKSLDFAMTSSEDLPVTISSDPTRLKQVMINVIGNAIKFTAAGAVDVAVDVDRTSGLLRVTVKDMGDGITPAQAAKLFRPFVQGDATMTRKFGGTGLGLDLARRLARALGGDVALKSSEPGKGSVFEINFALEDAQYTARQADSRAAAAPSTPQLDGMRVLLAEDAPENQVLITTYLNLGGAIVEVANDGEEAVTMALAKAYDVILMDIQMPNVDGYTATTRLRDQGYKGLIVALTAHAMRGENDRCLRAGCNAYLSKPVGRTELSQMLRNLVDGTTAGS